MEGLGCGESTGSIGVSDASTNLSDPDAEDRRERTSIIITIRSIHTTVQEEEINHYYLCIATNSSFRCNGYPSFEIISCQYYGSSILRNGIITRHKNLTIITLGVVKFREFEKWLTGRGRTVEYTRFGLTHSPTHTKYIIIKFQNIWTRFRGSPRIFSQNIAISPPNEPLHLNHRLLSESTQYMHEIKCAKFHNIWMSLWKDNK